MGPFGLNAEQRWPTWAGHCATRAQSIRTVCKVALAPTVEKASRSPELTARLAHVAQGLRPCHPPQAERV
jgi:hypothetical protein